MKIWFDILTPKQVMFFKPAVDLLQRSGHQLLCTGRGHGEAGKYEKLRENANRIFELAYIIKEFEPNIAITFSSPEGARVAFGLGIRHIGFNDSPHAEAVAKLTIPLMNHLFCPWVIPYSAWINFGISKNNITRYRALDPVAWIKRNPISHEK